MLRVIAIALLAACGAASAADLPGGAYGGAGAGYGYGAGASWRVNRAALDEEAACLAEWRRLNPPGAPIRATNSLCDPTYVGSSFGLNQPSYYGTLPRPGNAAYGWAGVEQRTPLPPAY